MKTSFKTRVSRMGLGSFVNINIFVMKYYFIQFVYILYFFESLKSKSPQMFQTLKRKHGSFGQRDSFKFWALIVLFYIQNPINNIMFFSPVLEFAQVCVKFTKTVLRILKLKLR